MISAKITLIRIGSNASGLNENLFIYMDTGKRQPPEIGIEADVRSPGKKSMHLWWIVIGLD